MVSPAAARSARSSSALPFLLAGEWEYPGLPLHHPQQANRTIGRLRSPHLPRPARAAGGLAIHTAASLPGGPLA